MLRVSTEEVSLSILTTWGLPGGDSRPADRWEDKGYTACTQKNCQVTHAYPTYLEIILNEGQCSMYKNRNNKDKNKLKNMHSVILVAFRH